MLTLIGRATLCALPDGGSSVSTIINGSSGYHYYYFLMNMTGSSTTYSFVLFLTVSSTSPYASSCGPCGFAEASTGLRWKANGWRPPRPPSSPWHRTPPTLTPSQSPAPCAPSSPNWRVAVFPSGEVSHTLDLTFQFDKYFHFIYLFLSPQPWSSTSDRSLYSARTRSPGSELLRRSRGERALEGSGLR